MPHESSFWEGFESVEAAKAERVAELCEHALNLRDRHLPQCLLSHDVPLQAVQSSAKERQLRFEDCAGLLRLRECPLHIVAELRGLVFCYSDSSHERLWNVLLLDHVHDGLTG